MRVKGAWDIYLGARVTGAGGESHYWIDMTWDMDRLAEASPPSPQSFYKVLGGWKLAPPKKLFIFFKF